MVYPGGVLIMTEAVSAPCATITDKTKVSSIDRVKNTVRLVFLSGVDKDQLIEYSLTGADVDSRIRSGDMPIMATCQGRQLLKLAFMPGTEPAEPAAQPHHPIVPPKQEQKPAEVQDNKWKIKLLKKEHDRALILTNTGKEEWLSFTGRAAEKIVRLNAGQLVKLKFENMTTFNDINPVDEHGEYDKSAWGGGGNKQSRYNPEAEKRRQESIEKQNARNIAKDILTLCFEQYPISAHQDNYEKAVSLFPQLMQMVKQGEEILMRGE